MVYCFVLWHLGEEYRATYFAQYVKRLNPLANKNKNMMVGKFFYVIHPPATIARVWWLPSGFRLLDSRASQKFRWCRGPPHHPLHCDCLHDNILAKRGHASLASAAVNLGKEANDNMTLAQSVPERRHPNGTKFYVLHVFTFSSSLLSATPR